MSINIIPEQFLREHVSLEDALKASRIAFEALAKDEVMLPGVMQFVLPGGETCVKGAWIRGRELFVLKMASSFGHGTYMVMNLEGKVVALLQDNGM